jgi:type IV secretory pathway VirJ component
MRLLIAAFLLLSVHAFAFAQTPPKAKAAPTKAAPKTAAKSVPPPLRNSPDQAWTESVISVPVIGHVVAYVPKTPVSSVVLFLSGDGRWNLGVVDWARRIMPKAIVLGVDYVALKNAHPTSGPCWLPAGDLEIISHAAQKTLKLPDYHPPIVVGYSSGATLVYEVLASAPPTTFAGGLSLGFCPDLPALQPVCPAENFKPTFDLKKSTAWLPKVTELPKDWYVLNGELDQVCLPPEMHKFLEGMKNVHFIEIPHTGHGFGKPAYWSQPFAESMDALIKSASAPKAAPAPPKSMAPLESKLALLSLPLEYVWAEQPRANVVFISGDGGWATIDEKVAAYVSTRGVNVIGLSSLRYFWSAKTPQQLGADLQRVVDSLAGTNLPLFLGGFSFGAEVAPFGLDAFSDAERRKVAGQILIAPGETASFEISPLDWVFRAKETPRRVADEVRKVKVPTFCLSGQLEQPRDTACDDIAAIGESVKLPGSHHFNGKYDDVGKVVLAFIDKHLK